MPVETGIRWAAALDGALREAGVAEAFWRYHAETLLPGVGASVETAISARNRETFSRLWNEVKISGSPWPQIPRLVEVALSVHQAEWRFIALRETVHGVWRQLGLPVALEVSLVLFAWGRN